MTLFDAKEAGAYLGLRPFTIKQCAYAGLLEHEKGFSREALDKYRREHPRRGPHNLTEQERGRNFNARYGKGSFRKLKYLLSETNMEYEVIGQKFDPHLTKERISQWHDILFPNAKNSGMRRRFLREQEDPSRRLRVQLKKTLENDLFRAFYRALDRYFPEGSLELIPKSAPSKGFRADSAVLNGKKVALRKASDKRDGSYEIHSPDTEADYIFYTFARKHFLFVPGRRLPTRTRFRMFDNTKYFDYVDTFYAIRRKR